MGTVDAPYPATVDTVDKLSIQSLERTSSLAIFKNRGGTVAATLTVKNDPNNLSKSIRRIGTRLKGYRDVLIRDFYRPTSSLTKATTSGSLAANAICVDWEPDSATMWVGQLNPPFMNIYYLTSTTTPDAFQQTTPAFDSGTLVQDMAWSPDGRHMLLISQVSPYVVMYQYAVGSTTPNILTPTFPSLPAATYTTLAWSPDGLSVAIGITSAPYLLIYKRDTVDDTVFVKISTSTGLAIPPTDMVLALAWTPDGKWLLVGGNTTAPLSLYRRVGDRFDKYPAPTTGGPATSLRSIAVSPDGQYVACGGITSSTFTWYKTNATGELLTKLTAPSTIPASNLISMSWSPDGQYLAVGQTSSAPLISLYKRIGDTLTKLPDSIFPSLPTGTNLIRKIKWSPDGKYLSAVSDITPFIHIYRGVSGPIAGGAIRGDTVVPLADGLQP